MNSLPDFLQPLETLIRPFPHEAIIAAIDHREESIPHLLHALEWADQNTDEANHGEPPYMLHLFALFLLAQFRETRSYPLVVSMARNAQVEDLLDDVITEDLGSILASVCGGDTRLIEGMIEDPTLYEFVRGAAVNALGVLLHTGAKTREEISGYIGELLTNRLEREPNHAWDCAIGICSDFGFREHIDTIRKCYAAGLADPMFDLLEDVEAEIVRPPGDPDRWRLMRYTLIDDTIAEIGSWYCFKPESAAEDDDWEDADLPNDPDDLAGDDWGSAQFAIRETTKIGRNEQCPCGSGKKYKKCCGAG
ncbi:MAG: DUF1186 domain-containing protein [Chthoniobacteraceae bacterium]